MNELVILSLNAMIGLDKIKNHVKLYINTS